MHLQVKNARVMFSFLQKYRKTALYYSKAVVLGLIWNKFKQKYLLVVCEDGKRKKSIVT